MSYDNGRAAKGQAYNLAVLTCIADGTYNQSREVFKAYLHHLTTAAIFQEASVEQISTVLECEKTLDKIEAIKLEISQL